MRNLMRKEYPLIWMFDEKCLSARIDHISPVPEDSKLRGYQLTLKSLQTKQPCHKMQADYFGNAVRSIECGSYHWIFFCLPEKENPLPWKLKWKVLILFLLFFIIVVAGDYVRCMGRLIGQTGRFRVMHISKINLNNEWTLIERLEAISSFELTQLS